MFKLWFQIYPIDYSKLLQCLPTSDSIIQGIHHLFSIGIIFPFQIKIVTEVTISCLP